MSDTAVRRIVIEKDPFAGKDPSWSRRAHWPARWIGLDAKMPFVAGYRLKFEIGNVKTVRLHVSAEVRYRLSLDGVSIGRVRIAATSTTGISRPTRSSSNPENTSWPPRSGPSASRPPTPSTRSATASSSPPKARP